MARVTVDAGALNALLDSAEKSFRLRGFANEVRSSVRATPEPALEVVSSVDATPFMTITRTLRERGDLNN